MKHKLIGIDLAKNVFQVCAINQAGKDVFNRSVTRAKLAATMAVFEPTTVALEACASGHYWGRKFEQMGPSGPAGATAACPAVRARRQERCPGCHWLSLRPPNGRSCIQCRSRLWHNRISKSLHRVRRQVIDQMTATGNQIRGIAREYGVEFKTGIHALVKQLPEVLEEAENESHPDGPSADCRAVGAVTALTVSATMPCMLELSNWPARIPLMADCWSCQAWGRSWLRPYLASIGNGHQFQQRT